MSKIIFRPINLESIGDDREAQGIIFVCVETKPFVQQGKFAEKNPLSGKFEEKNSKTFSRLKLMFKTQSEVDSFSVLVREGSFLEVESSKNGNVWSGKIGGELKDYLWIHEVSPSVQKSASQPASLPPTPLNNPQLTPPEPSSPNPSQNGEENNGDLLNEPIEVENNSTTGSQPTSPVSGNNSNSHSSNFSLPNSKISADSNKKSEQALEMKNPYLLWISGGGILILLIVFLLRFFQRRRKNKYS